MTRLWLCISTFLMREAEARERTAVISTMFLYFFMMKEREDSWMVGKETREGFCEDL